MSDAPCRSQPLTGCKVLDFSTLLPGPFATQMLAQAGAEVIKIERPNGGDELRAGTPRFGDTSLSFALLNAGKRSVAVDLKSDAARASLLPLLLEADVLVEQFRPGVMERLGLGHRALMDLNPRLIYCSITGYGQDGPSSQVAGHDLTYMAECGLLSLASDANGEPTIPPVLIGDIAGGSMPAVINILLALRYRDLTGQGSRLDISITDSLLSFPYWAIARGVGYADWPKTGQERLTGGSPRYQLYRTSEGRHVAAAPLEQRFWDVFCEVLGLAHQWRDDRVDPAGTRAAVAALVEQHDANHWRRKFSNVDACAVVVNTMEEAAAHPHFHSRGLFDRSIRDGDRTIPALKLPLDPQFIQKQAPDNGPSLGEGNGLLRGAVYS